MRMTRGVRLLGVALLVLLLGGVDELGIGSGRFGCGGVMAQMNPNEEGDEAKQDPLQPGAEVVTGDPDNFGHGGPGGAMGEVNRDGENEDEKSGLPSPDGVKDEEKFLRTSTQTLHDMREQVLMFQKLNNDLKKQNEVLQRRQDMFEMKFLRCSDELTVQSSALEDEQSHSNELQMNLESLRKAHQETNKITSTLMFEKLQIELKLHNCEEQKEDLNIAKEDLQAKIESLTTENASLKDATDKLHQVQSDNIAIQKQIDQLLQEKQAWEAVKNGSSEGQTNNISLASLKTCKDQLIAKQLEVDQLLQDKQALEAVKNGSSEGQTNNISLASFNACKDQLIAKQLEVDQLLQDKQALEAVKNGSSEGQTNNISLASFNACKDQLIAKQLEVDQLLQGMQARDAADALVRQKVQRRKRNDLIIGVLLGLVLPLLVLLVLLLYLCWQRSRQTVPNVGTMPSSFEMDFDFQQ